MESEETPNLRYSHGAITLHWLVAVLIIANYILVWTAEGKPEEQEHFLVGIHAATGIMILLLSVLRVIWRITHPAPPMEPGLKSWEVALATWVHRAFYFLIIAVPFTGWVMSSAASGGKGLNIYGLFDFPGLPIGPDRDTAIAVYEVHEILATVMFFLLILHVAAALKHHFVDRDGTVGRMIPFLRR